MKLILFICIVFLGYLSIGLLYFIVNWDDLMSALDDDDMTVRDKWLSILFTVVVWTPRNIIHDLIELTTKDRGENK